MKFRLTYTMPDGNEKPVFTGSDNGEFEANNIAFAKRQGAELVKKHMDVMGLISQTSANWEGNLSKCSKNVFCYQNGDPIHVIFNLYAIG